MKLQILYIKYTVEESTHLHYNLIYLYNQWYLVVCIIVHYKVKMKALLNYFK